MKQSRLQFSDAKIINTKHFSEIGFTEIKTENAIDRVSSVANPRQIERVVSGVEFQERIVYNVENKEELQEDIKNLAKGIMLLQLDYLGGHGSRGSGRVSFDEITISDAFSDLDKVTTASLTSILKKAEKYAPLSI